MRLPVILIVILSMAGCAVPRNGDDGMDGYGTAVGLRRELNRPTNH